MRKNSWHNIFIDRLVSLIFNPENIITLSLIILACRTFSGATLAWWLVIIIFLNFTFAYIWLFYVEDLGVAVDEPLQNAGEKRSRLVAIFPQFFVLIFEIILADLLGRQEPFYACLILLLSSGVLFSFVSFFWKVSAHAASSAAFFTILALIVSPWYWLLFLISPLIIKARLELHRHTITQLIVGNLAAILIVWLIFWVYGVI